MTEYIVNKGRSVRTERRGMAHEGGIISEKDFVSLAEKDRANFLSGLVESGKIKIVEVKAEKVEPKKVKDKAEKVEPKKVKGATKKVTTEKAENEADKETGDDSDLKKGAIKK